MKQDGSSAEMRVTRHAGPRGRWHAWSRGGSVGHVLSLVGRCSRRGWRVRFRREVDPRWRGGIGVRVGIGVFLVGLGVVV